MISVTSAHLASTITRTVSSVCVVLMVPTLAAVTIPRGSVSVITGGSVNARTMLRLVPVLVVAQDPSVWTEPTPMAAQSVSVSSDPTDVTRFPTSGER